MRFLRYLLTMARTEPILVRTFVGAVVVVLVELKVPISPDLAHAIDGVVVAALALSARSKVTPLVSLPPTPVVVHVDPSDGKAIEAALLNYRRTRGIGGV